MTSLLLSDKLHPSMNIAKSIGYRQAIQYLCRVKFEQEDFNEFDLFMKDFAASTRNYAKRQCNWHRKDGTSSFPDTHSLALTHPLTRIIL